MQVRKYFEGLPGAYGQSNNQEGVTKLPSARNTSVTDVQSSKATTVAASSNPVTVLRVLRTKREYFDFKRLAQEALNHSQRIVDHWLPGGHGRKEYTALNPQRADSHVGSFSVNLHTGKWADFATYDKGGDLISLVAYLERCSQGEAARLLAEFLELLPSKRPVPERNSRNNVTTSSEVTAPTGFTDSLTVTSVLRAPDDCVTHSCSEESTKILQPDPLLPWIKKIQAAPTPELVLDIVGNEFRPGDWSDEQRAQISQTYIRKLEQIGYPTYVPADVTYRGAA